jgi:2-oxoisovalerate ferredoxin oxidoreductase beta subunit
LGDVLKRESYENAIREMFASKPKVIDVNIEVLEAGAEWIKNNS